MTKPTKYQKHWMRYIKPDRPAQRIDGKWYYTIFDGPYTLRCHINIISIYNAVEKGLVIYSGEEIYLTPAGRRALEGK